MSQGTGNLPAIAEAVILRVQPGDVLVFKLPVDYVTRHTEEQIKAAWDRCVAGTAAEHVPLALFSKGVDVEVLRAADV